MRRFGAGSLIGAALAATLARWCAAAEPVALPLPEGSVLVECESLPHSDWHRYSDPEAGGGAKLLANDPAWVAEGSVELTAARYAVWVRSSDNGAYPLHYHYDLTIGQTTRTMAVTEPFGHTWVWERWGEVGAGRHTIRLSNADTFPAGADCILFTPDAGYRPSGRPRVEVSLRLPSPLPREGARAEFTFRPREALGEQRLFCALWEGTQLAWHGEVALSVPAAQWPAEEPATVTVSFPGFSLVAPGEYRLSAELSGCEYAGREEGDYTVGTVTLGPWEPARPCAAEVRRAQGTPALFINGRATFPFAFLGTSTSLYHEFAAAGGHLYSMGCPLGNEQGVGFDPTAVDAAFREVLEQDAEALIFPRIGVTAPDGWLAAHPEERVVFDDGTRGPQSMASEQWLADVGAQLAAFVRHTRSSPYADHVIGYHICSGVSAEWQAWGLWSERRGDFSAPMRRAFAEHLRGRYGSDEGLQGAWGDPRAALGTVAIPSRAARETPGPVLLSPQRDQQVIDFYECYPTVTARAIEHFARVVRDASEGEALVGVFYGYAPQYGPLAPESQHLALESVLRCPDVDFLCSPAMYSDRAPGGTSNFMSLTDSVALHGKLWLDEADLRTHLQTDLVGRCASMAETLGVLKREYGAVRAHGAGMWWFDMTGGWFSAPEISRLFGEMQAAGAAALADEHRPRFAPQIGAFFDERSARRQRPAAGDFYHYGVTMQVASLRRVGAPVALHLLSDLAEAPDYKVYLFLNATDLTEAQRALIAGLQRDGKTLIFVYAPGFGRVDARGLVREEVRGIEELTGLTVRRRRSAGPLRAALVVGEELCRNPVLLEAYAGAERAFGPPGEYAPRFTVVDPTATVLGRDADGEAVVVAKRMPHWTVVYSAVPGVPPGLLHNLAEAAGAHLFTDAGDALTAGRGIVALHARTAGEKRIRLPGTYAVRELLGAARRWPATDEVTVAVEANDTVALDVRDAIAAGDAPGALRLN